MNLKALKRLAPQLIAVFLIIAVIGYFWNNTRLNMEYLGMEFGYDFLSKAASFDIQFSLIDYDGSSPYFRAYLVGLLNTILVSVLGIIFATLIGLFIGVSRLSPNYLVSKLAEVYIEVFRNIPLLLQLFFWYFAVLRTLPLPENAISFGQSIFITIKGIYVPKFIWTNFNFFIISFILAIIVSFFIFSYAKKQRENYGKHFPAFWVSLGTIILFSGSGFLFGIVNLTFEYPEIYNLTETVFNYRGGVTIIPELLSLLFALSLYTSTFIAENVRAGILGVGKGQKEASSSLGLTPAQTLRLVVLPQALRIIIPPTTNQYLNLTKNSSLAAAIAYPDLVLVFAGTALNQTGRAIEIITITMGTYLTLSILISIFMNWYNKRIEIKEK
ncbi:MAG: amino acid ABC transporter permease [Pelagibacteraceae bacterium]|jgi:general L-amino acid transport system permease protein